MRIGIDLGGSHVGIGLVDSGRIIRKSECNFSKEDKENIVETIREFIFEQIDLILREVDINDIEAVGIGAPGRPVNGEITEAYNFKTVNLNIENMIKEKLDVPVCTKNDGICAGVAEKEYGNLKDCGNGIFLGLGTGIGMATFINGELVEEIKEVAHTAIEKNGKKCTCGRTGCFEAYCSMKVLKTNLRMRFGKENLPSKEILELLENAENLAKVEDIIEEYIEYLAICIANITRLCDTDTLVLGGSFVHFKDILFDRLLNKINEIVLPIERERFNIKLAMLGNDAGIIGAAYIL